MISVIITAIVFCMIFVIPPIIGNVQMVHSYDFSYYDLSANEKTLLILTISVLIVLIALGIYSGIKNKKAIVVPLVIVNIFKIVIIALGVFENPISDLLYCVYTSGFAYFCESLDIFAWVYYDIVLLVSFAFGAMIINLYRKKSLRNKTQ